jgi:peptide/nickel transport system ATP-binding protein
VMYLGRIVEIAQGRELFNHPRMPYTRMLLGAVPDLAMSGRQRIPVKGEIPNPIDPPPGCPFNPRCPRVFDRCVSEVPAVHNLGMGRTSRCHIAEEVVARG